jgi:hypothetical protein
MRMSRIRLPLAREGLSSPRPPLSVQLVMKHTAYTSDHVRVSTGISGRGIPLQTSGMTGSPLNLSRSLRKTRSQSSKACWKREYGLWTTTSPVPSE